MEIVVESDDSFLFESCSTLGKLERPVFFIQRYFDAFSLRSRRGSRVDRLDIFYDESEEKRLF